MDGKVEFKWLDENVNRLSKGVDHLIMAADGGEIPRGAIAIDDLIKDIALEDFQTGIWHHIVQTPRTWQ